MENVNTEQVTKIKEMIETMNMDSFNESLIKDNKIIFVIDKNVYRCVMPNQKQLTLAEDLENRLKMTMIQQSGMMSKKKLIKILKENQDIDIEDLQKQRETCQKELKNVYMNLALTPSIQTDIIEELKHEISKIEEKLTLLIIEITNELKPCIENQVRKKYYEFLTYQCTEKAGSNDDDWSRVWNTVNDYESSNDSISNKAVAYLQTLLLNIRD